MQHAADAVGAECSNLRQIKLPQGGGPRRKKRKSKKSKGKSKSSNATKAQVDALLNITQGLCGFVVLVAASGLIKSHLADSLS